MGERAAVEHGNLAEVWVIAGLLAGRERASPDGVDEALCATEAFVEVRLWDPVWRAVG